jgi:CheY-like chemotaxis protein
MDGRALGAELLKHPRWADIPVVIVSGMLDTSQDLDTLQAVEHLRKPIDLQRLYRVVAAHCAG